ncbi:MAG TPA: SOS response-associated peptidase [Candidatus Obscuribacterales bacterium]
MCGRFAQTQSGAVVAAAFGLSTVPDLTPRYNIAPSQSITVVTQSRSTGDRVAHEKRWGLIPRWSKTPSLGHKLINARSETVADKPAFRDAFQKRRCLVVADGFYEWQTLGDNRPKQPYLIRLRSRSLFAFAGVWERWRNPETAETTFSCTILTTAANDLMAPLHQRMPVILPAAAYAAWLDPHSSAPESLTDWLRPYPADDLEALPISNAINNARHDEPSVQEPAVDAADNPA